MIGVVAAYVGRRGCSVLLPSLLVPALQCQSPCAATPAGAVLQDLGLAERPGSSREGFRVRDVVFDAALHRSFVRVERCGHTEQPLILLPFAFAGRAGVATAQGVGLVQQPGNTEMVPSGTEVDVAMLDPRVQVRVRGRLLQSASVGAEVDVQLKLLASDEGAARRVRGVLTGAGRVEVRP